MAAGRRSDARIVAKGTKRINLALQGGGAHGAFTWGALDRLLEEDWLEIAAISGTSAGALNGAALKSGLAQGSREAAREALDWLWTQVGAVKDLRLPAWMAPFSPSAGTVSRWLELARPFSPAEMAGAFVSPYSYGPFYRNPLQPIAERFQYDHVCGDAGPELFIGATNVRSGKIRVFTGQEIGPEAILASACLPNVFQAIEITDPATGETEAYWDGGFTGNPPLFPLYAPHLPDDIVIVNINPLERPGIPRSPQEIENRVNEISFNSSLLRELRAVQFVKTLIADGRMPKGAMKDVLVHMIADDETMRALSVATKLIASPIVIGQLKRAGYAAADAFLAEHGDRIGREGSVSLREMFG